MQFAGIKGRLVCPNVIFTEPCRNAWAFLLNALRVFCELPMLVLWLWSCPRLSIPQIPVEAAQYRQGCRGKDVSTEAAQVPYSLLARLGQLGLGMLCNNLSFILQGYRWGAI